jgi:hypothetical protein
VCVSLKVVSLVSRSEEVGKGGEGLGNEGRREEGEGKRGRGMERYNLPLGPQRKPTVESARARMK